MKEPVDHILRPILPWREYARVTECGLIAEGRVPVIHREAFFARLRDFGAQRTALLTCMTCLQTAQRHSDWETDPRRALAREIDWETGWRKRQNGDRLRIELLAIERLIEAHSGEFAALCTEVRERQRWLDRKKRSAKK